MDIVADTYRNISVKAREVEVCGRNDKEIIISTKSKIPKDFQAVLRNGENKKRLIDLFCDILGTGCFPSFKHPSFIFLKRADVCE